MDYADLPHGMDDGLPIAQVRAWAKDKYLRVWGYAKVFSTSMKNRWHERVYVDLYAGPGYSRVEGTGEIICGSPLLALAVPDRFDRYIFCDADTAALDALRNRVQQIAPDVDAQYVPGSINETVDRVIGHIPRGFQTHRVLTFAFADPYSTGDVQFTTINRIAISRLADFLILLAGDMDANRNLKHYIRVTDDRIERFLGDPEWRIAWRRAKEEQPERTFGYFLAEAYSQAMVGLGYKPMPVEKMFHARSDKQNLPLYYLAFFSRHALGKQFWDDVHRSAKQQLEFPELG